MFILGSLFIIEGDYKMERKSWSRENKVILYFILTMPMVMDRFYSSYPELKSGT
jgi:hypothetical protein